MNLKNSVLILFFLISVCSKAQKATCDNFKTGKFEYSDPKYREWQITRTDSTQTEISTKTGIEIYSSLKWLNDCEYILTCNKVINPTTTNITGKVFHVKITDVYSNRYSCVAVSKNDNTTLKLMMIKVETFSNP